MQSKVSVITLGVKDLSQAVHFYQHGMGLILRADISNEYIGFFQLNGILLALYPAQLLAEDAGVAAEKTGFSAITLAQNVDSIDTVDTILNQAKSAGATITKLGEHKPWGGYSGYFKDADGHLWEIGYYPDLQINASEKA